MTTNLDASVTGKPQDSGWPTSSEVAGGKPTTLISNLQLGNGIQSTLEADVTELSFVAENDHPELLPPSTDALDLLEVKMPLSSEMKALLKTKEDVMPLGDLMKACAEILGKKLEENGSGAIDLEKTTAEDLELLCLLLCQESKSQLVKTLRSTMDAKIKERSVLQDKYLKKLDEINQKQIKQIKEAKKAKVRSVFKSILGAIGAVLGVIVGVAAVVATGGAALAVAGLVLGCVAAACTVTTTGLSIGATYSEDEALKARLNKANMAIGIAGAVVGIAGAICSGGAFSMSKTVDGILNAVKAATGIVEGASAVANGALDTADGILKIGAAKTQRELTDLKIKMEQVDQNIKILSEMLDQLGEDVQAFIKNMLECEQIAGSELGRMMEAALALANKQV